MQIKLLVQIESIKLSSNTRGLMCPKKWADVDVKYNSNGRGGLSSFKGKAFWLLAQNLS